MRVAGSESHRISRRIRSAPEVQLTDHVEQFVAVFGHLQQRQVKSVRFKLHLFHAADEIDGVVSARKRVRLRGAGHENPT